MHSNAANTFNEKLAAKYDGAYSITEIFFPTLFLLENGDSRRLHKVHTMDIKQYTSPRGDNKKP